MKGQKFVAIVLLCSCILFCAPVADATARRMSTFFASMEDLLAADSIDGVPFEKVEADAKPGSSAHMGWIGAHQTLRLVLEQDWRTVARLGITHVELARHLQNIWRLSRVCPGVEETTNMRGPGANNKLVYDVRSLEGNTLPYSRPQTLVLQCFFTNGFQMDLVHPEDPSRAWGVHWSISSDDGKINMQIGGTSRKGIVRYIEDFGFYEGGTDWSNEFRIDPEKLYRLLTGISPRNTSPILI